MPNDIQLENLGRLSDLPTQTQKHLDIIRRLEQSGFIFDIDTKVATESAKSIAGTPSDKLLYRANIIDKDGKLQNALHKGDFLVKSVERFYVILSFVFGFVGVFGLLNVHVVNFFYVLLGLLGWHTLTLVLWFVRLNNANRYFGIYDILAKLRPKSPIDAAAFDIHLEEFQQNSIWQLGKITHKAWLFGLLGSVLALFTLFLFKSYAFVWESTLLSQAHFAMILKGLGFIPSLLGFEMPSQISLSRGDITPSYLATLMMLSVAIYGIMPRLFAYGLCHLNARIRFTIDDGLYYYENLLRTFNQTIVNKDDFIPTTPKTKPTPQAHRMTVTATLEWPSKNDDWHEYRGQIQDVGAVDDKNDIARLIHTADILQAQILLGVDTRILPDRGVLRKFGIICQNSKHGILVKFLHGGAYIKEWREAINERGIAEY